MTSEKRVEEKVKEFVENYYSEGSEGGIVFSTGFNGQLIEDWLRTTLTQDRASLHTSLVAAVEGKSKKGYFAHSYKAVGNEGYFISKDDILTIINSIFKE